MDKLTFSFDIGYASIGWAVLKGGSAAEVLGTGVVLFPKDDCLASHRRAYRRLRRNIRARRLRIDRIGRVLEHHGVITAEQRRLPGHASPFRLAARALDGNVVLNGLEVWHLVRWYAHNRGYDGNRQWASDGREGEDEDTARVEAAKANMKRFGTATMAETITKLLGLESEGKQSTTKAYKTLDMAFPREVVEAEFRRLLLEHSLLPPHVAQLIIDPVEGQRAGLEACGVRLPRRFFGSLLFGQLLPRFDNRIIARCPITWADEYMKAKGAGQSEKAARLSADKYAKVPKADCVEFYEYRFARILSNIRVDGKPLEAAHRVRLMEMARQEGKFTILSFKKAVKGLIGEVSSNLYNFFQIHPESNKALIVVPNPDKPQERATGRAPYARPVLRRVVEEVLRGEDPTKPALSLSCPKGEIKEQDGVLYCLLDPESDVSRLQATRRVEDMSNNHLVRHRMLIFRRLLRDMIRKYADGDASRIGQFCIEVGRELSEFSGMSSKEIASELNKRMKHFNSAVKCLQNEAPHLPLSAGLIRKCRIAMDMDWTCPFTGQRYGACHLPQMEREHIIPQANRNSNSLASLVLTWPAVNRMKGKRTGLQFVKECGGQEVPGTSWSIMTEKRYLKLVEKLDTKGAPDDQRRKKQRKKFLLVDALAEKTAREEKLGLTQGMMTQSSQLMKIARHVAKGICPEASVCMIPGAVTSAVRGSWKAWGLLAEVCPGVVHNGCLLDKEAIRGITHLHHAVDACVLGLIPLLIPAGSNGIVWQALGMRRLTEELVGRLRGIVRGDMLRIDEARRVHLQPLPTAVRESFIRALREERVVTHVPADMSGAKFEENTRGLKALKNGSATLCKQKRVRKEDGTRKVIREEENMLIDKLVGIYPCGFSKLSRIKGVRAVKDNFGLALTPSPVVIPHHSVFKKLAALKAQYGTFSVLRKGHLVKLSRHKDAKRNKVWKVLGVANDASLGIVLNLQAVSSARRNGEKHPDNWRNAIVKSLMRSGFTALRTSYTGEMEELE